MIYIIQGQEQCFIKDKLKEITSSSDSEVVYFDGSDKNFSIGALLEACEGNSLFSQGSIVLVDQPFFLIRKSDEKQLQPLLDYISKPLYDTQLVFYTYLDNFSAKLKVYKAIAKNAQVITLNSLDYKNFNNYVRSRLNEEKVDISSDAAYQLNSICKRNAAVVCIVVKGAGFCKIFSTCNLESPVGKGNGDAATVMIIGQESLLQHVFAE